MCGGTCIGGGHPQAAVEWVYCQGMSKARSVLDIQVPVEL